MTSWPLSFLLLRALAAADATHLKTGSAAAYGAKRSVSSACSTSWPRTMSTTRRTFMAVMRMFFAWAMASLPARSLALFSATARPPIVLHVTLERAGRAELAQLVADHRLGDEHRDVLAAVVDGDGVT